MSFIPVSPSLGRVPWSCPIFTAFLQEGALQPVFSASISQFHLFLPEPQRTVGRAPLQSDREAEEDCGCPWSVPADRTVKDSQPPVLELGGSSNTVLTQVHRVTALKVFSSSRPPTNWPPCLKPGTQIPNSTSSLPEVNFFKKKKIVAHCTQDNAQTLS